MIKYYIRTFYKLPPGKWLLDSTEHLKEILQSIMASRPSHRKVKDNELENCISCVRINTETLPEYQTIFKEKRDWSWNDLDEMDKAWAKHPILGEIPHECI